MPFHIFTRIRIAAPQAAVWKVLTDFAAYPDWNPFVQQLTGKVAAGERITVHLPGMTFRPLVKAVVPDKELRWLGYLGVPGLFDGEHQFLLEDNRDGTTTFIHSETFNGLLVPLFRASLLKKTKPGFEAMNTALKQRVEKYYETLISPL
ncbi:SRPBCC domain-containing protein [Flavihumibacter petaseus]|uniref:SRPBCC domain-containing protein n=1 Tax=Flavihumibacter petaseus NBRC 106054 TaxID=1220578 RepID=A0A0E9MZ23_9BACT|nr:SRPBCC domain-containing protein [Flavihumibacter petaseus]GAO42972.1 hypothetical protein FPE01S_02_00770 [Flavihumibacter petaseus NBRC 106054]